MMVSVVHWGESDMRMDIRVFSDHTPQARPVMGIAELAIAGMEQSSRISIDAG
jgi:hypothetical protein